MKRFGKSRKIWKSWKKIEKYEKVRKVHKKNKKTSKSSEMLINMIMFGKTIQMLEKLVKSCKT